MEKDWDTVSSLFIGSFWFEPTRRWMNLHSATQTEHEVEGGLFLDIVVRKGATIFKLLAGEDETLLIGRNALLVLDLSLNVLDCVGRFDIKGDCLSRKRFDKDLHCELCFVSCVCLCMCCGCDLAVRFIFL